MKILAVAKSMMHWVGGLLALIGVVFVIVRLWSYVGQMDFAALGAGTWAALGLLSLIYGSANILLALSWRELLKHFGVVVPWTWAVWVYGVSQIAKYVPGNIFHLAGRQALGVAAGYSHRLMVVSAVWELGLIAATGALFGVLALPLVVDHLVVFVSVLVFLTLLVCFALGLRYFFNVLVARAMVLHACFLVVSGSLFVALVTLLGGQTDLALSNVPLLVGAFVFAWLVGLVTPGAPAGIGVRELVLLFLLAGQMPEADLVLAVGLGRFVTATGDVLFFLVTVVWGRRRVLQSHNS